MSLEHLQAFLDGAAGSLCPDPVFVVGSPRSGTTALARALGHHRGLWTSHESYVVHQLYGHDRARQAWQRDAERKQAPSWLKTEEVEREEFLGFLGAGINALYTSRSGGRRWVDQTPLNTLMLDDLAEMFPGAQFVHVLRDGRHVVHSMTNFIRKFDDRPEARRYVPAWAADFGEACRTWRQWVQSAASFGQANPGRTTTVLIDRLSGEPRPAFDELYTFLGLEWEDGPVEFIASQRVNSSFGDESAPRGLPSSPRLPQWDDERRLIFADECGEVLLGHGLADRGELQAWLAGVPVVARTGSATGGG